MTDLHFYNTYGSKHHKFAPILQQVERFSFDCSLRKLITSEGNHMRAVGKEAPRGHEVHLKRPIAAVTYVYSQQKKREDGKRERYII